MQVLAPLLIVLVLLPFIPFLHLFQRANILMHDSLYLLGLVVGDVGGGFVEFEGRLALLLLEVGLIARGVRHLRHKGVQLLLVVLVLVRLLHPFLLILLLLLLQFHGVSTSDVVVAVEAFFLTGEVGHEVGLTLAVLLELLGEPRVHDLRLVALTSHLHYRLVVQLVLVYRLAHIQ